MDINKELLGGLRSAVKKGESLQKAMMTFYNAGYRKEEVESAAAILQKEKFSLPVFQEAKVLMEKEKLEMPEKKKKEIKLPKIFKKRSKKVSAYGESESMEAKKKKKLGKAILIITLIIALLFVGLWIVFLLST